MQDAYLSLNPVVSWFDMACEFGTSFFAPPGGGARSPAGVPMTEFHEDHCLYVPEKGARPGAPMVVMLHGAGQDPVDFAAGTAMNAAAERHGFVVLYPAQTGRHSAHRCWNWFDVTHQTREAGEPARIVSLTLEIADAQRIDADRVYVAGLSAGGAMAALLGELFPDVFAAVGVHSGLAPRCGIDLSSGLAAMRGSTRSATPPTGMPTIVFHGECDAVVSPINGRQVMEASLGVGDPLAIQEHVGGGGRRHTLRVYGSDAEGVCGEHWTLHGAGHAWSGGSGAGSYADPLGPDASDEMLRFFGRHRLAPARPAPSRAAARVAGVPGP